MKMDLKSMLPAEKKPLSASVKCSLQGDGFRVENIIFRSRPRYPVTANLYIPEGADHNPGLLFLGGNVSEGKADETLQSTVRKFVACGFVVLVMDTAGQGERRLFDDVANAEDIAGNPEKEIAIISRQMNLVGESFEIWALWDAVRAIDFLETRNEVDLRRIFVTEWQGGNMADLLPQVDARPAAVASCVPQPEELCSRFCQAAGIAMVKKEYDTPLFSFQELQCTPFGMVSRLDGQIMLWDFVRAEADEYRVMRQCLSQNELQKKLRQILDIDENFISENLPAVGKKEHVVINVRLCGDGKLAAVEHSADCLDIEVSDCSSGTRKLLGIIESLNRQGVKNIDIAAQGYGAVIVLFAAVLSEKIKNAILKNLPESFDSLLRKRVISLPDAVVPHGILKFTDIPDLLGVVGANVIK